MAGKEKVDIIRSDQFQEVDEELSRAMADLDNTLERISVVFNGESDENSLPDTENPALAEAPASGDKELAATPTGDGSIPTPASPEPEERCVAASHPD